MDKPDSETIHNSISGQHIPSDGITAAEREIDQLVYQLGVYPALGGSLTEEEIKVVEGK